MLHDHYESVVKDMLDFAYKYLNFYTGLLSAILAATLTGLLTIKPGDTRVMALLLGPLLVLILARVGYSNVRVFYRRYIEAWVVTMNIEAMLGIRYADTLTIGTKRPVFPSKRGSFLPVIEREPIGRTLGKARSEQWNAEKVVQEIAKVGDTLVNARNTFILFGAASSILIIFIVWIALAR